MFVCMYVGLCVSHAILKGKTNSMCFDIIDMYKCSINMVFRKRNEEHYSFKFF